VKTSVLMTFSGGISQKNTSTGQQGLLENGVYYNLIRVLV